jgi:hypothetical protein
MGKLQLRLALAILAFAAIANPACAKSTATLKDVIAATGMDASFGHFSDGIKMGFSQAPISKPNRNELIAAAASAADAAFAVEPLKAALHKEMSDKLSQADLDAVMNFYREPLAKRMTDLENASAGKEAYEEMQRMAAELGEKLRSDPDRRDLYSSMDKSLGLTEAAVDSNVSLQRAMITGMAAGDGVTVPPEDMEKMMTQARGQAREQLSKLIQVAMAYTYRDVSLEDLRVYLKFLSSPAGQKLYSAGRDAKNRVLVAASLVFGEELSKRLKSPKL